MSLLPRIWEKRLPKAWSKATVDAIALGEYLSREAAGDPTWSTENARRHLTSAELTALERRLFDFGFRPPPTGLFRRAGTALERLRP